jgi:hypothetical protein
MCFGVRAGSRKGVCIAAKAASSQVLGMVCPGLEAQIETNPAISVVFRLVAVESFMVRRRLE